MLPTVTVGTSLLLWPDLRMVVRLQPGEFNIFHEIS